MNKKIMNAALSTSGHYVDIDANILYVTTTFNKKAEIYGTSECSKMTNHTSPVKLCRPSMTRFSSCVVREIDK